MNPIDYLSRFWESILFPTDKLKIGPPPVSAEVMAWITLIGGIIGFIMFVDWLWDKVKPK